MKERVLYNLCRIMLDKESTQISLDQLYEDEEIGHYVKNIQIDSPFQQLIFSGIITIVNKGDEITVSFTVEGYFHFTLSKYLYSIDKNEMNLSSLTNA